MDFLIDGNAYLNVALSVTRSILYKDKGVGKKYYVNDIFNEGKYILKEEVKVQFKKFCINYLSSLIAPVGSNIDRVHLVFDSRSWRKEYINKAFEKNLFDSEVAPVKFDYKGNRKKDDKIYLFFEYFQDEIIPVLIRETNINYYRIPGTEGDDIIAFLCEKIENDILAYTVDGDLRQLVYNKDKNIILIYPKQMSKHKKLFVPKELHPDLADDEDDNFFSLTESHIVEPSMSKTIKTLKNKDYFEYVVDPVTEIFTKIFRGDKKDNIPKLHKMTPIKTNKLILEIKKDYGNSSIDLLDSLDKDFIGYIVEKISLLNKINDLNKLQDIQKHFIFNSKIIRLSSSLFPEKIKTLLEKDFESKTFLSFDNKRFSNIKNNLSII